MYKRQPLSLPLAILLAALMTSGNFGERYEFLSMKAAGIPLLRIIRPLINFCTFLCCTSFYFQNVIAPKAQIKLLTLLAVSYTHLDVYKRQLQISIYLYFPEQSIIRQ